MKHKTNEHPIDRAERIENNEWKNFEKLKYRHEEIWDKDKRIIDVGKLLLKINSEKTGRINRSRILKRALRS